MMKYVKGSAGREIENVRDGVLTTGNEKKSANESEDENSFQQKAENEQVLKKQTAPPVTEQVGSQLDSSRKMITDNSEPGVEPGKKLESDFNATSADVGEQVEAVPEPGKKFLFWRPFDFRYKAQSFAAQVKDKSGVDCLIEKENGEYNVYFMYGDEDDRLEKISFIEEATKLKISDHGRVY